jgi:mono/diheme cytochrome c family protein
MRIMQTENGHRRTRIGGRLAHVRPLIVSLVAILILPSQAQAQVSPAVQRGLQFSQTNCSRCHSIDKVSPSPLSIAPPFRTLHQRYPVENLQVPLAEGIRTGHPTMPEFRLDPGQIADLIALLNTLK